MYEFPYGNSQQMNLNWIVNEIINLHKQLNPDYETPTFSQIYPYSNLGQLNLDWILSELKTLKELAPEPVPTEVDIQAVAEALVALPFDSSKSYQIYDFISKDGEIYRATEAIAAGGVWDEAKWFKTKLGTDLAVLERWINAINADLTTLQNTVEDLSSADISDDSDAGGATVKASLNNLKGSLNTVENSIAFIINGKRLQGSTAVSAGQYVLLLNSTISGKTDGLYKAAATIPINTDIDGTYLTAVSGGGLNVLNDALTVEDLTPSITYNTDYVLANSVLVKKYGHIVYVTATIKPIQSDAASILSGLPLCYGSGALATMGYQATGLPVTTGMIWLERNQTVLNFYGSSNNNATMCFFYLTP